MNNDTLSPLQLIIMLGGSIWIIVSAINNFRAKMHAIEVKRPYHDALEELSKYIPGKVAKLNKFFGGRLSLDCNFSGHKFSIHYCYRESKAEVKGLYIVCNFHPSRKLKIYLYNQELPSAFVPFFTKKVHIDDVEFEGYHIYTNKPDQAKCYFATKRDTIKQLISHGWLPITITGNEISINTTVSKPGLDPEKIQETLLNMIALDTDTSDLPLQANARVANDVTITDPIGVIKQSKETSLPNKKGVLIYIVACLAIVMLGLSGYGLMAWYIPSKEYVLIGTLPAVGLGLWFNYKLWRSGSLQTQKPANLFVLFLLIIIFCWNGLVLGLPAAASKFLEPNAEEKVTVAKKIRLTRNWNYNLKLAGYYKPGFCVDSTLWNQVSVGCKVRLLVRKDYFGTRIYDIKPATE